MAPATSRKAAAAERKAADGKKTNEQRMVEALLAERAGYVQRGAKYKDRVAQVDAQIKAYGGDVPKGGTATQTAAEKKAEAEAKAAAEKEAAEKAEAEKKAAADKAAADAKASS